MKEVDKRKTPNTNRTKRAGKPEKRDQKPNQGNAGKTVSGKDTQSKASHAKLDSRTVVSDSNTGTKPSEVYENLVIHYVDDVNRSEQAARAPKANQKLSKEIVDDVVDGSSSELDKESKQGKEEVSDSETSKDSVSSQGDSLMAEDEKVEESVMSEKSSTERSFEGSKERSDQIKPSNQRPSSETAKSSSQGNSKNVIVHSKPSSDSSNGVDNEYVAEVEGSDSLIETSNGAGKIGSNNGTVDAEENGVHENEAVLEKKTQEMEARIEKLEEELREVAALEISLYSVVPEHGSSAHKVHTPARRLSRLYIHACKYWTQDKRATVAKNTVSGLLLIAKSCGNDVPRLTFWLSNAVVLREIISQAFGGSRHSSPVTWLAESNGNGTRSEMKSTMKWKGSSGSRHINGFTPCLEDWQETGTFTAALEKVESWIFSRVVESVWWQALTPNMQSPVENLSNNKNIGRLLGPALGDQTQGSFSISLWKNAFQDAAQRLCPVRAGGHECGCLPVLARMVMEQCIARLDVAMFNAILRESAHEIPTDPVSDPIVDSKVLPIPAGDLSFGSGAQLKNSVGNWSRWLTDMFGIDADDVPREDQDCNDDNDKLGGDGEPKSFLLLNSLSDLLMLPKDMLMDRSIRKEVCPSISLPLIKRILCNFTPDEFCPDPVPGAVLEALNAESIVERRLSGDAVRSFPYTVAPVVYTPPSPADVAEKCEVSDTGGRSELARNVSVVQRKGYTSDEELEELESPLLAIIDKLPLSPSTVANGNGKHKDNTGYASVNERYELLSEVWSM